MAKKVAYFTNIAPHYRERLWNIFLSDKTIEFHFYFGRSSKKDIEEIDFESSDWVRCRDRIHNLKNRRVKKILIWQSGVLYNILRGNYSAVIFLGDMYIVSTWIATFIAKMRGIPVLFWGHGMYGNEPFIKKFFRKSFLRLTDKHLLYGHNAEEQMINEGFIAEDLIVVYNSLDYDQHLRLRVRVIDPNYYPKLNFFGNNNLPILIFIGRLTPQKRLEKLIETLQTLNIGVPRANLMIVGDGPEKSNLQKKAEFSKENIFFYGACYDEEEIGRLLANATLCVSPGNVGLTAIHSLSFGTPVCTHDDMLNQMPEAEAIIESETGTYFNKRLDNLKDVVYDWLQSKNREYIRKQCYKIIDEKYNPYRQLEIFKNILLEVSE